MTNPYTPPATQAAETFPWPVANLLAAYLAVMGITSAVFIMYSETPALQWIFVGFVLLLAVTIWRKVRASWFFAVFFMQTQILVLPFTILAFDQWMVQAVTAVQLLLAVVFLMLLFKSPVMDVFKVRTDVKFIYFLAIPFIGLIVTSVVGGLFYFLLIADLI